MLAEPEHLLLAQVKEELEEIHISQFLDLLRNLFMQLHLDFMQPAVAQTMVLKVFQMLLKQVDLDQLVLTLVFTVVAEEQTDVVVLQLLLKQMEKLIQEAQGVDVLMQEPDQEFLEQVEVEL